MDVLELPFHYVRIPNLKLRIPKFERPSAMVVFAVLFASYFLVMSGIIYDVIVEPPSIGSSQDPETKSVKPVAILQYRVNGQYIIEGLAAGLLFSIGGVGVILLDRAASKFTADRNRFLLFLSAVLSIVVTYNVALVFLRIKVPGYMRS